MSLVLVAVVAGILIAMLLFAAFADEPGLEAEEHGDAPTPVRDFLEAARHRSRDLEQRRRRLLAMATGTARQLAACLKTGEDVADPLARAAAVSLVEDLGLGGLRELAHALEAVDLGHPAVPTLVRASACCGTGAWEAVARCGPDVRSLVAAEVAVEIAPRLASDSDVAFTCAAALVAAGRAVPAPLRSTAASLPGGGAWTRPSSPPPPSVPSDAPEPSDVGGAEWTAWASRHVAEPRVRETLRRVAVTSGPGADHALALLGGANPAEVALLLRERRRDSWAAVSPSWLRVALSGAGDEAERVVVEMLALLPVPSAAGDALADTRPSRALGWWIDAYARSTPAGRTFIDAALRVDVAAVAEGLVAAIGDDGPRSHAAAELAGRLRLTAAVPALAEFGRHGERCAARAIWALEMIGVPPPEALVLEAPYLRPTAAFLAALGPRPGLNRAGSGTAGARSG